MAAYGVIGGIIGGAIAFAITPLLRKPIGWCKDKAKDEVARYKHIKPWE